MRYEHVKAERVDYYLNDLHLSTRGPVRDRADRLNEYFRSKDGKDDWEILVCDVCDGHSPSHLDDCPFCGESDIDRSETKPISDVDPDTGVQSKTVYYIDDLHRIQREIAKNKRSVARGLHRIGKLLGCVHQNALWRMRREKFINGDQYYKSFKAWVADDGAFSFSSAKRLMSLASQLSIDAYEVLLTELIATIRTWDLRKRMEIEDFTFKGLSQGDARPTLRYNDDVGYHIEVLPSKDFNLTLDRRTIQPLRPENRMERVDLNIGLSRIPLFKRTQSDEPAVEIGDDPWLEIQLNESISIFVRIIQTPAGKLEAICETKRKAN